MAEVSSGLRSILKIPLVYKTWGLLLGGPAASADYIASYLQPEPGERLLDIGCGTADHLKLLPDDVSYLGFDVSESYIRAAR